MPDFINLHDPFWPVIDALRFERCFQNDKHGTVQENPHTPGGWLLLIEAELIEAKVALIKGGRGRDSWRQEVLQIAATCIACLEQHGVEEPPPNGRREI